MMRARFKELNGKSEAATNISPKQVIGYFLLIEEEGKKSPRTLVSQFSNVLQGNRNDTQVGTFQTTRYQDVKCKLLHLLDHYLSDNGHDNQLPDPECMHRRPVLEAHFEG